MDRTEILEAFKSLFQGHDRYYGQYPMLGEGMPWTEKRRPLTDSQWIGHLTGKGYGLGRVPVRDDGQCRWAAIDYDTKPRKLTSDELCSLQDRVRASGLPLIVCRSKSGGAHLYLFLSEWTPASIIRKLLRAWAIHLEINWSFDQKGNKRLTEIFPKQDILDPDSPGSWINLPYFGGSRTDRFAVGDRPECGPPAPRTLVEFMSDASATAIDRKQAQLMLQDQPEQRVSSLHPQAPPCLQTLDAQGYGDGSGRNNAMFSLGLFFIKAFPEHWQQRMRDYNLENMDPPLTDAEINGTITSLRRDAEKAEPKYKYKCTDIPINSVCQKDVCRTRVYGISSFEDTSSSTVIERLVKVETDPPKWVAYVQGSPIDVSTEELLDARRFKRKVLEAINQLIKLETAGRWERMIERLLLTLETIAAPEDAGVFGQFKTNIRAFIERRVTVAEFKTPQEAWEQVVRGYPLELDGWIYFQSKHLIKHLEERCKFRDYRPNDLYNALRKMGGVHEPKPKKIAGQAINLWAMPVPSEGGEQTKPFAPLKDEGSDF